MILTLLFIALLLAGAVLLLIDFIGNNNNKKVLFRFEKTLNNKQFSSITPKAWYQQLMQLSFGNNDEIKRLLTRAGWDSPHKKLLFWMFGRVLPAAIAISVFVVLATQNDDIAHATLMGIFTFALLFLMANYICRWQAATIEKEMIKELVPFLHILRMLFNAGLSLERALTIVASKESNLLPHLSRHFRRVLQNFNAGQDQSEALANMAKAIDIQEVTDTISIISQASRYGGNLQSSLGQYIEITETRQFSTLREYVSKLSAKMTIVMIVFMFPSLIIFIAGPGLIGISNALSQAS